jgi:hypothetical protein
MRDIWAYRDWVVNALNANMPFDQFTLEQIAGDLLPNATPSQIIATGFHRCTPTNVEAGTDPEESRINQVIDRVNTTGAVWLGTTLECAQCHNHKYDPFTQRDYYSLLAYYNNTEKEADRTKIPAFPAPSQFKGSPVISSAILRANSSSASNSAAAIESARQADHRGQQQITTTSATQTRLQHVRPSLLESRQSLKPTAFITDSDAETELQLTAACFSPVPCPKRHLHLRKPSSVATELSGI